MHADAGRLGRRREGRGDLAVVQSVEDTERDRVPLAVRKPGERLVEPFEPGHVGLGRGKGRLVHDAEPLACRPLEPAAPDGCDEHVARDREQPRGRRAAAFVAEPSPREPDPRERLGGEVVRRTVVAAPRPPPSSGPSRRSRGGAGTLRLTSPGMEIVVLSGGVGGARFLRGLADVVERERLTVIGNVGDDVEILGLAVSPDLDSVLYGLAGLGDDERGWGRAGETWNALEEARRLGGEGWFALGDRDLGVHLVRTQALAAGEPLSAITARLAQRLGLRERILPATDDRLRTWVETADGWLPFQDWFVARGHRDEVEAVRFEGADEARPAPGVLEA